MRIILFRHGETEENKRRIIQGQTLGTLTKEGIEGARKLAVRLSSAHFTVVYSSDLERSRITTQEVMRYHPQTPVVFTELLRERDCGSLVGEPYEAFEAPSFPEDFETDAMMIARAREFIAAHITPHITSEDCIGISTHGAFSRMFATALLDRLDINPDNVGGLSNTALSEFEYIHGVWQKTVDNSATHLQ